MTFLLTLSVVHLLAVMTPGPDFLIVSKIAISNSRRAAMMAALGVAVGVMVWAGLALMGLHLLFERIAWLQVLLKIVGGTYLFYLGVMMLKASLVQSSPGGTSNTQAPVDGRNAFRSGLLTNLANPKAAIYFGSIFATFFNTKTNAADKIAMFSLVSLESVIWFLFVAILFSMPAPRRFYNRAQKWIDRIAGTTFTFFGLRLVWNSMS